MRRALISAALAAAGLTAAADASAVPRPAGVKLVTCSIEKREATFHARMGLVEGAQRMALRFTLLERTGDHGFAPLKAPALRTWRVSRPGVRVFGYRQTVRNLPANASHRMRVHFRWYAGDGSLVARARRRSPVCRQYMALPNLTAWISRAARSKVAGVLRYEAVVTNAGRADAAAVPLRLTIDGDVVDTVTVASLAAGERRSVMIRGPACRHSVKLEADPDRLISETSDLDNLHEVGCEALTNAP